MANPRVIGAFLIGLGVAMWGVSLVHDPWAQERYERMVRENARLDNRLLYSIDLALQVMQYFGYALMASAFFIMNRVPVLSILSLIPILALGVLYYSHNMYFSDRFGGDKTIVGALYTLAATSAALLSSLSTNQEKHDKQTQKKEKSKKSKKD